MIVVTRLNGPQFGVNPDLLERIEATPDTVLTLIDGTKFVVVESVSELVQRIVEFRARVVVAATQMTADPSKAPQLAAVAEALTEEDTASKLAPAVPLRPEGGDNGSR